MVVQTFDSVTLNLPFEFKRIVEFEIVANLKRYENKYIMLIEC